MAEELEVFCGSNLNLYPNFWFYDASPKDSMLWMKRADDFKTGAKKKESKTVGFELTPTIQAFSWPDNEILALHNFFVSVRSSTSLPRMSNDQETVISNVYVLSKQAIKPTKTSKHGVYDVCAVIATLRIKLRHQQLFKSSRPMVNIHNALYDIIKLYVTQDHTLVFVNGLATLPSVSQRSVDVAKLTASAYTHTRKTHPNS
jgi:hypothetical protein